MADSHKKQLDVLCVGDVGTDAYIKLIDKYEYVEDTKDGLVLNVPFGTKIPFDFAQVVEGTGNASNASVSFARLGLKSGLVSNIGGDSWGADIVRTLQKNGVDTRFVHENPGKVSNYNYILWYKSERTILVKHEEYDYLWPRFRKVDMPRWMYFSSVSESAMEYHDDISDWLDENPEVRLAFQPGTFQMDLGIDRLKRIYERAEIVVLNREEATAVFDGDHKDIHDLLDKMHQAGINIAMITDGPQGAYASDGNCRWRMPLYPDPAPPLERTGAGDAFASTFTAAIMMGADIPAALLWAPINSMNVVQHVGSQEGLLTDSQIDYYLRNAPKNYHPEEI